MVYMKISKRMVAMAVATVMAPAGIIATAAGPSAAASGGGCDSGAVGYGGFSISACISSSNDNLIADAYGHGSTTGSCYVYIEIVDASYNVIASSGTQGCTSGHHNGTSIWEAYGTYRAAACLVWGGVPRGCSFSPSVTNP